jgi:hypothetical protein
MALVNATNEQASAFLLAGDNVLCVRVFAGIAFVEIAEDINGLRAVKLAGDDGQPCIFYEETCRLIEPISGMYYRLNAQTAPMSGEISEITMP